MFIARYKPLFEPLLFFTKKSFHQSVNEKYFKNARTALCYIFENIKRKDGKNKVLLSSFICPVVVEVLKSFNYELSYLDTLKNSIEFSPQQIRDCIDEDTVAIILTPYFGIIHYSYSEIKTLIKNSSIYLILDCAQGVGCGLSDIHADIIITSYGIGKGVDCYGGKLLNKTNANFLIQTKKESYFSYYWDLLNTLLKLTILNLKTFYKLMGPLIDSQYQVNKKFKKEAYTELRKESIGLILNREEIFKDKIKIAQQRAQEIYNIPAMSYYLIDKESIDMKSSSFLRLPILALDYQQKEKIKDYFMSQGIEATDAKEVLYDARLVNTQNLYDRMLKLPFLGTISDKEYNYLITVIQKLPEFHGIQYAK